MTEKQGGIQEERVMVVDQSVGQSLHQAPLQAEPKRDGATLFEFETKVRQRKEKHFRCTVEIPAGIFRVEFFFFFYLSAYF